jgi:hypothetical protein
MQILTDRDLDGPPIAGMRDAVARCIAQSAIAEKTS